jgi:hypothetical protein
VSNDLVGIAEIAERAGVTKDAVQKWRQRYADFPQPVAQLAATPVWAWQDVARWIEASGRGALLTEAQ